MNANQRGFAPIVIILLVLFVGAVGCFVWVTNSEPLAPVAQQPTPKESQTSAEVEKPFVLTGKRETGSNANLYTGHVIVEGQYGVDYDPDHFGGDGTLFFSVDEQYRTKLPQKYNDYPVSFIFSNEVVAKQMLAIQDGDKDLKKHFGCCF